MRVIPLLLVPLLAACSASPVDAPSLLPRPAEATDPRVPVPEPALRTEPMPALVATLDSLIAQAIAGDRDFQPLIAHAADLARSAGPRESESWIAAQQALSIAIAARAPVGSAVGDIDALGAQRVQASGGIGAADLKAIDSAAARVAQIDSSEAATVARIQAQLSR